MNFQTMRLAEPIHRALLDARYTTPTPIQIAAIPHVLTGRDLIGIAQTGTGKTAAFALPILQRLALRPARPAAKTCRALVLAPTRELSNQIAESFRTYGRHLRVRVACVIGGVPIRRQAEALAGGVDILIATPGRLLDLMRSGSVRFEGVEVLVLDEADRMLDMGFIRDVRTIVARLPHERQTLLFSATFPPEIATLAAQMLRHPETVSVTPIASTVERIEQRVVHADGPTKPGLLAELLRREPIDRALVFTRTKRGADKVTRALVQAGIAADALHGNKSQNQRERVLASFRAGRTRTLVATDIAARGIDVAGISHVINYDLPNIPETYVHRIGRTARAGAPGVAVSFCVADELPFLRAIERLTRQSIASSGQSSAQAGNSAHRTQPGHRADSRPKRRGRRYRNFSRSTSRIEARADTR